MRAVRRVVYPRAMHTPDEDAPSAWWRAMRTRLTALSTTAPMTPDALEATLRARVATLLALDDGAGRVALPARFRQLLVDVGATVWLGQRVSLDFMLVPAAGVMGRFEHAIELFNDDECPGLRGAGVWVEFASRGDKTSWFLCCDPTRPEFGLVGAGDDAHPWLNGADWIAPLTTLDAWCDRTRATRSRPRAPVLVALDAGRAAALARAAGDPREALIAVRELLDARVPDSAWSHTLGATADTLLVQSRAPFEATLRAAGAVPLRDDAVTHALTLDAAKLAPGSVPAVAPWEVLAWDDARRALRAVSDSAGCLRAFCERAAREGRTLLWVVEEGGAE